MRRVGIIVAVIIALAIPIFSPQHIVGAVSPTLVLHEIANDTADTFMLYTHQAGVTYGNGTWYVAWGNPYKIASSTDLSNWSIVATSSLSLSRSGIDLWYDGKLRGAFTTSGYNAYYMTYPPLSESSIYNSANYLIGGGVASINGNIYVVWHEGPLNSIYVYNVTGGTTSSISGVGSASTSTGGVSISPLGGEELLIVVKEGDNALYYSIYYPSAGWTSMQTLNTTVAAGWGGFQLIYNDVDGNVYILYEDDANLLRYVIISPDGSKQTGLVADYGIKAFAGGCTDGKVWAVFATSPSNYIYYTEWNGTAWTTPVLVYQSDYDILRMNGPKQPVPKPVFLMVINDTTSGLYRLYAVQTTTTTTSTITTTVANALVPAPAPAPATTITPPPEPVGEDKGKLIALAVAAFLLLILLATAMRRR